MITVYLTYDKSLCFKNLIWKFEHNLYSSEKEIGGREEGAMSKKEGER